ncbi:50S ribosomal protein L17 [Patescibacteria group bacterium]|nr:50S ribosomal protein L17 [Patescibacteria group bacterium]MBU1895983.1 50S ribosomal protein L17 [Patescibacteria group bacterium]
MRHRKKNRSLGRVKRQREALLRNLADSLILHGKIETTLAKAKELRIFIEPLVTKAVVGTLADRRNLIKVLYTDEAVRKLMDEYGPKYKERPGGYTRITKLGPRANDCAEMGVIEFV